MDPEGVMEDFFDDEGYTWTKNYTWAVSTLRQFHDSLLMTIDAWQEFALGDIQYFATGSTKLDALWKEYMDSLFDDMSELRYLQRSLLQRIQTFDRMKDGVCSGLVPRIETSYTDQSVPSLSMLLRLEKVAIRRSKVRTLRY